MTATPLYDAMCRAIDAAYEVDEVQAIRRRDKPAALAGYVTMKSGAVLLFRELEARRPCGGPRPGACRMGEAPHDLAPGRQGVAMSAESAAATARRAHRIAAEAHGVDGPRTAQRFTHAQNCAKSNQAGRPHGTNRPDERRINNNTPNNNNVTKGTDQ
jgi:hypothetical protein